MTATREPEAMTEIDAGLGWGSQLWLWDDDEAHSPALNMAVDEVLLGKVERPLLRFYRWDRPAVSIGYFQSWTVSHEQAWLGDGEGRLVRRWTGGGLVDHRADLTYSLFFPAEHPLATCRADQSYRFIHAWVMESLAALGGGDEGASPRLLEAASPTLDGGGHCFREPVNWDVVDGGGAKLAGAAQRRSRGRRLHQGSVQLASLPPDSWDSLRRSMGRSLTESHQVAFQAFEAGAEVLAEAEGLAAEKYASPEWTRRR